MKTLFVNLALLSSLCVYAQAPSPAPATTTVSDVLHYYLNKQYFRQATPLTRMPYYQAPSATATNIAHLGNKFDNPDGAVEVTGLEAYGSRTKRSSSQVFPARIYLFDLDAQGLPYWPPLDSVESAMTSTVPVLFGGQFKDNKTYLMTRPFAVLARNMSTTHGDTLNLLRTDGKTSANPLTPADQRFSDGNGIVRFAGVYRSVTDFTFTGFGVGSDYEFCVAPRVTYTLHAEQDVPSNVAQLCTQEPAVFRSLSSKAISNPMYNLYEFCRKWGQTPFHPNVPGSLIPADSAIYWFFEMEDNHGSPGPRLYLPYKAASTSVVFKTDSSAGLKNVAGGDSSQCYPANQFRVRWHGMDAFGAGTSWFYQEDFTVCTSFCDRDAVGLDSRSGEDLKVYPNPTSGLLTLEGAGAGRKVIVESMDGRFILTGTSPLLDISLLPRGVYFLKADTGTGVRIQKVVKD